MTCDNGDQLIVLLGEGQACESFEFQWRQISGDAGEQCFARYRLIIACYLRYDCMKRYCIYDICALALHKCLVECNHIILRYIVAILMINMNHQSLSIFASADRTILIVPEHESTYGDPMSKSCKVHSERMK